LAERFSDDRVSGTLSLTAAYFLVNLGAWLWYTLWGKYVVLDLGFGGEELGVLTMLYNLSYALATFPSGRISDIMEPKKILSIGAAICSIGALFLAFSTSFPLIASACILTGLGEGVFFTSATVYAVRRGGLSRAGTVYGIVFSAGLLGEISGSLASGFLKELFGSKILFVTSSIVSFSALPFIMLLRGKPMLASGSRRSLSLVGILKEHAEFRLLAAGLIFHSLGFNAILPFISIYAGWLGLSDSGIGLVNFFWLLFMLFTTMPWSILADRLESRLILLGHLSLSFFSWIIYAHSWNFASIMAAAAFMGLVSSMDMPARRKLVAELDKGYGVGSLIGSLDLLTMLSSIPAPLLGGLLYQSIGLKQLFWTASAINLLGIPFLFRMSRVNRGQADA